MTALRWVLSALCLVLFVTALVVRRREVWALTGAVGVVTGLVWALGDS